MSASAKKEFKELQGIIRRKGYKVVPGSGHYKVLDSHGRRVVDENGPVILSSSPSDFRARDLAAARLIRANVLKAEDLPWKPQKPKLMLGEPDDAADDEKRDQKAEKRESERAANRTRSERTQLIRARLEPIVTSLGGWGKRGLVAELADVIHHHSKGAPGAFPSKQAARSNTISLRKGGTLSEDKATLWEALLETIEQAPSAREAWFDLVRQARGLPSRAVPVVVLRGLDLLEREYGPRFADKINCEVLDIRNTTWCVLGQLGGDYYAACGQLGLSIADACSYGFESAGDNDSEWDALQEAWEEALCR